MDSIGLNCQQNIKKWSAKLSIVVKIVASCAWDPSSLWTLKQLQQYVYIFLCGVLRKRNPNTIGDFNFFYFSSQYSVIDSWWCLSTVLSKNRYLVDTIALMQHYYKKLKNYMFFLFEFVYNGIQNTLSYIFFISNVDHKINVFFSISISLLINFKHSLLWKL